MFGNSPKVFSSHYNGLATPEDALFFCADARAARAM
jgi:hypothetical protein